jgi:L-Ala-D/L-Glu epimerase
VSADGAPLAAPRRRVTVEVFALARRFAISRGAKTEARVVVVELEAEGVRGRGEAVPYARYGESIESVVAAIDGLPATLDRTRLQALLPAGAARNAVDCALWDLAAKHAGRPVWALAGLRPPGPEVCAYTLSLDEPAAMAAQARLHAARPLLKVKLGTAHDLDRLEAVRRGAPHSRLIVDANEGWSVDDYRRLCPDLQRLGVSLVEQPLPAGDDGALLGLPRPVPLCADESCHDRASLPGLRGRYDAVNIKLDKTGGLTEALALRAAAEAAGYAVMVGCMVASSLAMAPAVLLAQGALITDLDGPLLLTADRASGLDYSGHRVHPPLPALWG